MPKATKASMQAEAATAIKKALDENDFTGFETNVIRWISVHPQNPARKLRRMAHFMGLILNVRGWHKDLNELIELLKHVQIDAQQCCERDHNHDGNCDRHSSPGVLRERK